MFVRFTQVFVTFLVIERTDSINSLINISIAFNLVYNITLMFNAFHWSTLKLSKCLMMPEIQNSERCYINSTCLFFRLLSLAFVLL